MSSYEGMVAANCDRKLSLLCVPSHNIGNCFCDARYQARVLQDTDRRVAGDRGANTLKLVVSVKLYRPSEAFKLFNNPRFDNLNWSSVDPCLGLFGE